MSKKINYSQFQEAIDVVETLPKDDQALLIDILQQLLIEHRREVLANEIDEAREYYHRGNVKRGTVDELMRDLSA